MTERSSTKIHGLIGRAELKGTNYTLSFFSLVFFFLGISLVFWCVFCFFYRVFKGSHGEKNPWCFWGLPWCFRKDQGKEGQTKWDDLRKSAVSCENLRFSAKICASEMQKFPGKAKISKISESLWKTENLVPFSWSLLIPLDYWQGLVNEHQYHWAQKRIKGRTSTFGNQSLLSLTGRFVWEDYFAHNRTNGYSRTLRCRNFQISSAPLLTGQMILENLSLIFWSIIFSGKWSCSSFERNGHSKRDWFPLSSEA